MDLMTVTQDIVAQFSLSPFGVDRSVKEFLRQIFQGLQADGNSLSQIPTYVTGVPNGTERGLYLAVDLGGTNYRVCSVRLNGNGTCNVKSDKVRIPKRLMTAKTASKLFAFLAGRVDKFLHDHHPAELRDHKAKIKRLHEERLKNSSGAGRASGGAPQPSASLTPPPSPNADDVFNLGFTFSFPVRQLAIDRGVLIRWTKGFDIPDAIGKDVCSLLQVELDKLELPVRVAALVNDTVGTLMARAYTSPSASAYEQAEHMDRSPLLGAIFGTGTNGAYMEDTCNIKKPIHGDYDVSTGTMVVNTEWGSFDNQLAVLPWTTWDDALDRASVNPGVQMFEKRVSGMFLGEIVRLVVAGMALGRVDADSETGEDDDDDTHRGTEESATEAAADSETSENNGAPTNGIEESAATEAEADRGTAVTETEADHSTVTTEADHGTTTTGGGQDVESDLAGCLFRGVDSGTVIAPDAPLWKPWALDTLILSVAAADTTPDLSIIRARLESALGVSSPSLEDARAFKAISHAVVRRAARLSAVAIAAVVLHSGRLRDPKVNVVDVGVDGSLVVHYPKFMEMIYEALREIDGIGLCNADRIIIEPAKDGSSVGAALIALMAAKTNKWFLRSNLSEEILHQLELEEKQDDGHLGHALHYPFSLGVITGVLGGIAMGATLYFLHHKR